VVGPHRILRFLLPLFGLLASTLSLVNLHELYQLGLLECIRIFYQYPWACPCYMETRWATPNLLFSDPWPFLNP
jgi:hypothetical protein